MQVRHRLLCLTREKLRRSVCVALSYGVTLLVVSNDGAKDINETPYTSNLAAMNA